MLLSVESIKNEYINFSFTVQVIKKKKRKDFLELIFDDLMHNADEVPNIEIWILEFQGRMNEILVIG